MLSEQKTSHRIIIKKIHKNDNYNVTLTTESNRSFFYNANTR